MLEVSREGAVVLCLVGLLCGSSICRAAVCPDDGKAARSLCREFRDIRDLIPVNVTSAIVSRHYQFDAKFRHAMLFLSSPAFVAVAAQIEQSRAFQQMLMQFTNASVDTTELANITGMVDCLLLPDIENAQQQQEQPQEQSQQQQEVPQILIQMQQLVVNRKQKTKWKFEDYADGDDYDDGDDDFWIAARSLQTFATEMINAIPRSQYVELLTRNLANNEQFARFYEVVRDASFQRKVLRGLKSRELSRPLRKLRKNCINVRRLLMTAITLFSWGPTTY